MNEIRVNSWIELQEQLFADSYDSGRNLWRSPYAFRGLGDSNYRLLNSLTRMGQQYPQLESSLLRSFRKYAPEAVQEQDSEWHWLSLAQHHGLPTRLLDWTWSPQVAAHFATEETESYDRDGVVWAVNVVLVRDELPTELQKILRGEAYVFDVRMLSQVVPELMSLKAMSRSDYAVFFEPPSIDARIVNQYAVFSVMDDPCRAFDDWLIQRPHLHKKIIIPKDLKWEVRDKLDQINLNERVLFPGLDGLCAWLKRNYIARISLTLNSSR